MNFLFPCDDNNGFILKISRSSDGDFWLTIVPKIDHHNYEINIHRPSGTVRIRCPFVGGGMYENLYRGLMTAIGQEMKDISIDEMKQYIDVQQALFEMRMAPHKEDRMNIILRLLEQLGHSEVVDVYRS